MIEGVFHPLKVKLITQRSLNKKFKSSIRKDEVLEGLYDQHDNTIYVASDLTAEQQLHIFGHELVHYLDDITHRCDTEARCDAIGGWFVRILKNKPLMELLSEFTVKK